MDRLETRMDRMESETSRIGADLVGVKVAIARWEGPEKHLQRLWLAREAAEPTRFLSSGIRPVCLILAPPVDWTSRTGVHWQVARAAKGS